MNSLGHNNVLNSDIATALFNVQNFTLYITWGQHLVINTGTTDTVTTVGCTVVHFW